MAAAAPLVLIAGAGPTGMTAAIELKRAGLGVRIIDKADHGALHSQALVVQARTLEQFQRYGIASSAVEHGRKLTGARLWSDGKNILSYIFDRVPSRYPFLLMLPQTETERILNAHMESLGVTAERGTELVSLNQHDERLSVIVRHGDGTEERIQPRWLIGCDGAHSTIRQQAGIPFEGGGVGLSFFLADVEMDGPDAPGDELAIHLHHGDVVFMAPLTDRIVRLIVAVHARQDEHLQRDLTLRDFQDAVHNVGVKVQIHSAEWMTPFHVTDLQARHYRAGSVFLAGDASHIHSPVGGQGMNTGIQDVANLAWKLAAVARGASDSLLDTYQEERAAVGRALLRFTERGLKLATTPNSLFEMMRDVLMPFITRLEPVQDAMLGFISETAIEYRASSIVADHSTDGSLRAGDRLPDISILNGSGPHPLLRDWTEARHLVLALDPGPAEVADLRTTLTEARIVSFSLSQLDEEGRRLIGEERKILIVRPDGYIGFRGPLKEPYDWQAHARQDAIAMESSRVPVA